MVQLPAMNALRKIADRKNFLLVRSTADVRAWEVAMTQEGLEIAAQIHREVQEALELLVDRFDEAYQALLERVAQLARGAGGAGGRRVMRVSGAGAGGLPGPLVSLDRWPDGGGWPRRSGALTMC
jgi:hypothetical protein